MKVSALCVLYLVFGAALMVLCFSFVTSNSLSVSDAVFNNRMAEMKMTSTSKKLKEKSYRDRNVNVEDYNPIDPVPSSKASIKPGPIEHGTPLNPFIPKPSPPPAPAHPKKFD